MIWLPTLSTDTTATQVYRYNVFNRSWVRWTIGANAGLVNSVDDKIYLAKIAKIHQERKTDDRTDFSDDQCILTIPQQCVVACTNQLILSSVSVVIKGDVITQVQCVTVVKFNRLLRKLDADSEMECNYFSTIEISTGNDLSDKMVTLITKVDADDCTVCYTAPTGGTFAQDKIDFNLLTTELNNSTKPIFNNYFCVTDTTEYAAIITAICSSTNKVTLCACIPFLKGSVTYFKGICAEIGWAPQHFGDASVTKQVPEGSIDFDGNNFYSATISYATDLSKNFEDKEFFGKGPGYWGNGNYNCTTWGGCGTEVPLRTLVPKEKQRCRYIFVKFKHINAREDFRILGISLTPRRMSTRGWKKM